MNFPATSTQLRQLAPVKPQQYGSAKIIKFDVPDLKSPVGIENSVLQDAATYMLRVFEQELERKDLTEMYHMNREATYSSYLNLITEQTLLYMLEDLNHIDVHNGESMEYSVEDKMMYVRNNLETLRPTLNVYAFNIMTRVVSQLLDMVHGIQHIGLRVDTLDLRRDNAVPDTVKVWCYVSPNVGDLINQ